MSAVSFVVAGCKPWNRRVFDDELAGAGWHLVSEPSQLTLENLDRWSPRYVFFLHWSWRVPSEILDKYECVCFHMTDVPYGRGGSPLQNLIVRGHRTTKLTALRMVADFDAGPVYLKEDLSLEGRAEEIYERASRQAVGMMRRIVAEAIDPVPQDGTPTVFRRRSPAESELHAGMSVEQVFDFIRMLDAETYPHAFLRWGGLRFEFTDASRADSAVIAAVRITREETHG